jgi:RES domain-containing protein
MKVWRIATDTPAYVADDLSGAGAKATGGRWNRPGQPVLYCAQSPSLACLETLVHLGSGGLPLNRFLVEVDIPTPQWAARERQTGDKLGLGWDVCPAGKVSLDFGDAWLARRRSAILAVPSAIVPEDLVILINPEHPDASAVTARKVRRWLYDPRFRSR